MGIKVCFSFHRTVDCLFKTTFPVTTKKSTNIARLLCLEFPGLHFVFPVSPCHVNVQLIGPWEICTKFRQVIFKLISVTDGWGISCKIVLRWMPLDLTDDKLTLVQVMAWCRQATSHYLSQCWLRDLCRYMVSLGHNESKLDINIRVYM